MARICFVCDKRPQSAHHVSKANNKVKRWLFPNIQKFRFTLAKDPHRKVHRAGVCTKCMKAGKINKVI